MSRGDLPLVTLGDTPQVTQCDPLYEPSSEFEEEEEGAAALEIEIVEEKRMPDELAHLSPVQLEAAIDRAVSRLSRSSPAGYRRVLQEGLARGEQGWIDTVLEMARSSSSSSLSIRDRRALGEFKGEIRTRIELLVESGVSHDSIQRTVRDMCAGSIFSREVLEEAVREAYLHAGIVGVA